MYKALTLAPVLVQISLAALIDSSDLFLSGDAYDFYYPDVIITDSNQAVTNTGKGIDISSSLSLSSATCLKNAGYTTVVARAY